MLKFKMISFNPWDHKSQIFKYHSLKYPSKINNSNNKSTNKEPNPVSMDIQ